MNKTTILAVLAASLIIPCTVPGQVPAVMYHAHENLGYVEEDFRDHMEFLVGNEFTTIDMDQFYEWHQNDAILPYRPIIITVDDNYILGYTSMYPILVELGMVAINYTHTRGIGIGAPKASWAQVREMDESGVFLVESHSQSHPNLTQISAAQLFDEVHGSRDDISANVNGKVTRHFCYPFGKYNQAVIDECIAAGYLTGITVLRGLNYRDTPLFELRRWLGDGKNLDEFLVETGFDDLPEPPPGDGWILDDSDPNAYYDTGIWASSTSIAGYFGPTYRTRSADVEDPEPFRWAAYLPTEDTTFRVHARWSSLDNRSTNAVYTVRTAAGDEDVAVDQTINGGEWVELGVFSFAEPGLVEVLLDGGEDGYLIADALWFEPAELPTSEGWVIH